MATYPLAPQRVATTARARMATKGCRRPRAWRGSSISANTSINGRHVSVIAPPLSQLDSAVSGEVYPTTRLSNSPGSFRIGAGDCGRSTKLGLMIRFQFEYPERLRAAFIGCGDHAYRNIYPCLQYAPVELVAVCDRREERARHYARLFGAGAVYADHHVMLAKERPQVVFIVTGYDADARPTYPPLAIDVMRAGAHAWIEKPPAASAAEIEAMIAAEQETGRFTMVGFKKMFFPAVAKAAEIAARPEFGGVASVALRYPQSLPAAEKRGDARAMLGFLDHLCHPASILQRIAGPVERFTYERETINGGLVVSLRFRGGAIGAFHMAAGQSGTSPLERLEVVGKGANLVVENGSRLTYYRPGRRGEGG